MTIIQKILKDHRVEEISDERSVGDGFWVYLKVGYYGYEEGSHIIHEDTPTLCFYLLRDSRRCSCDDCVESEERALDARNRVAVLSQELSAQKNK